MNGNSTLTNKRDKSFILLPKCCDSIDFGFLSGQVTPDQVPRKVIK